MGDAFLANMDVIIKKEEREVCVKETRRYFVFRINDAEYFSFVHYPLGFSSVNFTVYPRLL